MATKKLNSISNEFSESENDISTNELIKNIQIIANSTQIPSESESEVDEEAWLSYMKHLKKNILRESSPIEKRRKHLDGLTLGTDEELMLKNQNYVSEFDDEDNDELIEEIEKHLNESFFSTISSKPQGASSPKELTHQKRNNSDSLYETMSSRIFNSENNSLVNRSASIGYHSFKPEHKNHLLSCSKKMDKLESNTFNKINRKYESIILTDSEAEEDEEGEDTESSPIVISLLSSSEDEPDEDDHNSKSFDENEFNESKTDEISFKLKNLKVAAVKPNVIPESKEIESTPVSSAVKIISNDLIPNKINFEPVKILKTNEPVKILKTNPFLQPSESNKNPFQSSLESNKNPFQPSLESNKNPFQPSVESNNTSVKLSKTQKRKLRRQRRKKIIKKAALKEEQQNSCEWRQPLKDHQNVEKSPETEIELPSGKRTKIDDKGKFLSKTPEHIKENNEKRRRNKLKASKYIKFIPGGIVQFGTKDNNTNITNQLKLNQKNLTDDKEYKIELAKILNTIGGEIIIKLGYEVGKGLGKRLQGIQRPIEAYIRKGRGSIGKYGSEMSLPTSIKIQEKQYKILKALGKSELDLEENENKKKKKEPGIYSAVNFDYSNLKNSENVKNLTSENNNEIMVDPLSKEKYSNIVIQFHNDNIDDDNNNDEKSFKKSKQLKKIRKIINCELLQLCIFDESSHLYSYQLQELKTNLEKLIINAAMHCNINCLQFESCYIDSKNGCLLLNCTNEITYDWVEELLLTSSAMQNFLPNVNLVIKNFRKSLPLTHKMEIFIPGENLMTIEYLKILENQNPGLKTKNWKIYKRNDLRDFVNLILGITEESYKVLEFNYNFRPYLGLGRIKFYPIDL